MSGCGVPSSSTNLRAITGFYRLGCQPSVGCSLTPPAPRARAGPTLEKLDNWNRTVASATPDQQLKNYQNLVGALIVPDRTALRTSSIDARPRGAIPPHSNRVEADVQ